jgi:hypothetical protein
VHGGGRCDLRCALCDCAAPASPPEEIERALEGGGARVVVRGPTERSPAIGDLVARARQHGFAEIVLRTNAIACATPSNAAAFARSVPMRCWCRCSRMTPPCTIASPDAGARCAMRWRACATWRVPG